MKRNLMLVLLLSRFIKKVFRLNALLVLIAMILLTTESWAVGNNNRNRSQSNFTVEQQTVTGKVTDESGSGLPGVTVVVQGTTNGAITDIDGNYSLGNVPASAILQFTFVGMVSQEIAVEGKSVINVTMEEETIGLEEVVATGYATEKKKDIVGSVAIVSTDDMNKAASPSLSSKLQGRASGVTASGSGEGGTKIRIRGFGSLTGGNDPLYIIDGTPGNGDAINPDDIESIQVLKDAASASIYGARGANGVIIITTKKGQAGTTKVEYSSYMGINYATGFPDLLSTEELGELYWKSFSYVGAGEHPQFGVYSDTNSPLDLDYVLAQDGGSYYGNYALNTYKNSANSSDNAYYESLIDPDNYDRATHQIVKYNGDTDWYEEAFRNAFIQNHQISVSGGNSDAVFNISANYNGGETTTLYGYNDRLTFRANSAFTIQDNIRIGENMQVQYSRSRGGVGTGSLYYVVPYQPVKDEWGNWVGMKVPGTKDDMSNPIADASRSDLQRNGSWGVFGNLYLEVDVLPGLTLKTSIGIDHTNNFSRNFSYGTYENRNSSDNNSLSYSAGTGTSWTWTNTATYSKTINDHSFKVMVGSEAMKSLNESVGATGYDFLIDDDINYLVMSAAQNETQLQSISGDWNSSSLESYFGRVDYTYADKYLFNATIRHDGSPKFSEDNRWGNFPAVGLGWRISEESFMEDASWIDDLKLRGSWGIIGNQGGLTALNQYTTYAASFAVYPDGSASGYLDSYGLSHIGNSDAKWEETKTTNIGFDATIFDQKWDISAEWYNKTTDDLLVSYNAPATGPGAAAGGPPGAGGSVSQPMINLGSIRNLGIDASVTNRGEITSGLNYEATITFSTYKNEALKISKSEDAVYESNEFFSNMLNVTQVGEEISYYKGYVIDGFFDDQAEVDAYNETTTGSFITPAIGKWKIKDVDGDGVIDSDDKTKLGSPHPDFTMGFNMNLSYKNFDLSGFFYLQKGGDKINMMPYYTDQLVGYYSKSPTMLYDSWTPDNHDAKLPILDSSDGESFKYMTSYWVEDCSFLRLKTLQLGYTLPKSVINAIGISSCRIYAQASNVFTITNYSNMEPDGSLSGDDLGMGNDRGSAPVPKQAIFGINLSF